MSCKDFYQYVMANMDILDRAKSYYILSSAIYSDILKEKRQQQQKKDYFSLKQNHKFLKFGVFLH